MKNTLYLALCGFFLAVLGSCGEGYPETNIGSMQPNLESPQPHIKTGEIVPPSACVLSAPVGSIPVVMPDGTLGASPLKVVDGFVYSNATIVVVLGGEGEADMALRNAIAERKHGFYTANSIHSDASIAARSATLYGELAAVSATIHAGLTANSVHSQTWVEAEGALNAGSASIPGSIKTGFLYTDGALVSGKLTALSVSTSQTDGTGWVVCPEEGECACPDDEHVTKTANRGARIFCAK